ncbi:MAG: hypothetical protein ACK4TC_17200 [Sphingomonas pseudosanguinis]|uniref:hypothetical protein n=1 Tax=Sphingomonas pseudosanguinis TaxID=413712 RepID=UPI0039194F19
MKNNHATTANPSTMSAADRAFALKWLQKRIGKFGRFHRTDDELPSPQSVEEWGKRRGSGNVEVCVSPTSKRVLAIYWHNEQDFRDFEETAYGLFDVVVTA